MTDMKTILAACRDLQQRHREMADELGRLIRDLCWQMSQSVETSAPAPAPATVRPPAMPVPTVAVMSTAAALPPAPTSPAPADAQWAGVLWTPARNKVLIRTWPLGMELDEIKALLNDLPGKPMLRDRIAIQAAKLNVKRPPREAPMQVPAPPRERPPAERKSVVIPLDAPPVVAPPSDVDPAMVRGKPGVWLPPVSKSTGDIADYAARMGFEYVGVSDLTAFNRHRVARGYAPLAVRLPGNPAFKGLFTKAPT